MEVLLKIAIFLKKLFTQPNYSVRRIVMSYDSNGEPWDIESDFWRNEARSWGGDWEPEENEVDITQIGIAGVPPAPPSVSNITYRITYMYGGNVYKFVTRDKEYQWPPVKVPGFNPPLRDAWAELENGAYIDVTYRLKKFAGPNSDFHGHELTLRDVVREDCVKLKLTNIMGQMTETTTSISRKKLWVS
jgi:hypothetical protein